MAELNPPEPNRIRYWREKHGITQQQLASVCDRLWTQGRIAHYEAGRRTPNVDDCKVLLQAFRELGVKGLTFEDVFPQGV